MRIVLKLEETHAVRSGVGLGTRDERRGGAGLGLVIVSAVVAGTRARCSRPCMYGRGGFGACSAVLPVPISKQDLIPANQEADARIRTADSFITS